MLGLLGFKNARNAGFDIPQPASLEYLSLPYNILVYNYTK